MPQKRLKGKRNKFYLIFIYCTVKNQDYTFNFLLRLLLAYSVITLFHVLLINYKFEFHRQLFFEQFIIFRKKINLNLSRFASKLPVLGTLEHLTFYPKS